MTKFKAKIYNSTLIGHKSLVIEFPSDDLPELWKVMVKAGIELEYSNYRG